MGLGSFGYRFITGGLRGGYRATRAMGRMALNEAARQAAEHENYKRQMALGQVAVQEALLKAFLDEKQQEWDRNVERQRLHGQNIAYGVMSELRWFGAYRAVFRYQMNNKFGRIDVFYGGAGYNPLQTPDHDYHGHIIVFGKEIIEWWLPGPKNQRLRVR